MGDQGVDVTLDHPRGRWIGPAVLAGERDELVARLGRRMGLVEDPPPARLDLAMVALGELRGHLPQGVDRAALLGGLRPELAGGLPEPRRAVGDHERRSPQSALDEVRPNESHDS